MYIALDGLDGVGKSTTIKEMNRILTEKGFNVIQVAEPGDTPNCETDSVRDGIRKLLKTKQMDQRTQAFLFFADRNELLSSPKIQDNLNNDSIILSDRCFAATYAYQSTDGGLKDMDFHGLLNYMENTYPDIIVLFDASDDVIEKRLKDRNDSPDVLESVSKRTINKRRTGFRNFQRFVDLAYLSRSSREFNPLVINYTVTGDLSPEETATDILKKIAVLVDLDLANYNREFSEKSSWNRDDIRPKMFATAKASEMYITAFDYTFLGNTKEKTKPKKTRSTKS